MVCRGIVRSLAIWLVASTGCAAPTPPAEVPKASSEVSALVLALDKTAAPPELGAAVAAELAQAGFVLGSPQGADAIATLEVTQTRHQGFMAVYKNGREVITLDNSVVLSVGDENNPVDSARVMFQAHEGEVDQAQIQELVRQLAHSERLAAYSVEVRRRRVEEAAQAERDATEQQAAALAQSVEAARQEQEIAWVNANVRSCTSPTALDGCRGVELYRARYPGGAHDEEARAALETAEPKLQLLHKDEEAWQRAGAEACTDGAHAKACAGVEIYLAKFPAGLHQVEAHRRLDSASGAE